MNAFLNKTFAASQKPGGHSVKPHTKPRIPMSYIHSREIDTTYELSQAGIHSLPRSIIHMLRSPHSKAKARVTTDQKTGKLLAKIIKVRLADLDVYSPNTEYDFRISINLEKRMGDNWHQLVQPRPQDVAKVFRHKDRVSYSHLAYQIDLTQVISSDVSSNSNIHMDLKLICHSRSKKSTSSKSSFQQPSYANTACSYETAGPTSLGDLSRDSRTTSGS